MKSISVPNNVIVEGSILRNTEDDESSSDSGSESDTEQSIDEDKYGRTQKSQMNDDEDEALEYFGTTTTSSTTTIRKIEKYAADVNLNVDGVDAKVSEGRLSFCFFVYVFEIDDLRC